MMKRFPEFIRNGMDYSGSSITCLPVQIDAGDWESAIFFQLGGRESKEDRRILSRLRATVPVSVEAQLIEHNSAAVIVIRFEVYTRQDNPLVGEVLLTPGHIQAHFETMKLLTKQSLLRWFFSDAAYWIIHSQQNRLGKSEHEAFQKVLDDATRHDAFVRITGTYDVEAALREVVSHYEFRSANSSQATSSSSM